MTPTSRILVRSAGGSVREFDFAAGASLAEHSTPHEALVAVLGGALCVTLGGETWTVCAGETVRFPAGEPHALHAPEASRMLLVQLHTD